MWWLSIMQRVTNRPLENVQNRRYQCLCIGTQYSQSRRTNDPIHDFTSAMCKPSFKYPYTLWITQSANGTQPTQELTTVNSLRPGDAIWRCTEICVNISPGNDLLSDGTKPLPEPILTFFSERIPESNFTASVQAILHSAWWAWKLYF